MLQKLICKATEAAYIAAMKQDKDAREDVKDAEASLNAKVVDISSEEEDDEDDFNGEVQDAFAVNGSLIEVDGDDEDEGGEKKQATAPTPAMGRMVQRMAVGRREPLYPRNRAVVRAKKPEVMLTSSK